jgi:CheY-like chemotaxis protein
MNHSSVLVVDDDPDNREIIADILRYEGFEVSVAADGVGALSEVRRRKPGLVLLDLVLPGMDGWRVLDTIRADAALHDVPVLVMSAAVPLVDRADEPRLRKPFGRRELLDAVRARTQPSAH